jgi:hypothetical protein
MNVIVEAADRQGISVKCEGYSAGRLAVAGEGHW